MWSGGASPCRRLHVWSRRRGQGHWSRQSDAMLLPQDGQATDARPRQALRSLGQHPLLHAPAQAAPKARQAASVAVCADAGVSTDKSPAEACEDQLAEMCTRDLPGAQSRSPAASMCLHTEGGTPMSTVPVSGPSQQHSAHQQSPARPACDVDKMLLSAGEQAPTCHARRSHPPGSCRLPGHATACRRGCCSAGGTVT